jgi:hypothetical protein
MPRKAKDRTRIFQDPDFPNRYIIEHQETLGTVEFWAKRLGVAYPTMHRRITTMPLEKALTPGKMSNAFGTSVTAEKKVANIKKSFKVMKAPNPEDKGKWFTTKEGEIAFRYKNSVKTIKQWAAVQGMNTNTLKSRLLTKKQPIRIAVVKEFIHGTGSAYDTLKCRCDVCRAGNAQRHREYQQRVRGDTETGKPPKKTLKK